MGKLEPGPHDLIPQELLKKIVSGFLMGKRIGVSDDFIGFITL